MKINQKKKKIVFNTKSHIMFSENHGKKNKLRNPALFLRQEASHMHDKILIFLSV